MNVCSLTFVTLSTLLFPKQHIYYRLMGFTITHLVLNNYFASSFRFHDLVQK